MRRAVVASLMCAVPALADVEGGQMSARQISDGIDRVGGEVQRLEARFAQMPDLAATSEEELSQRASTGVLFYAMHDYQRSSLLLFSAVDPPGMDATKYAREPWYADAVFALAESLYQTNNLIPARSYFERVLAIPGHPDKDIAIQRLMELSGRLGDLGPVDAYYDQYVKLVGDKVPDDVRYLRGKVLLIGDQPERAIEELAKIPMNAPHDMRARYLVGAAQVKLGRIDDALATFGAVAKGIRVAKEDRDVRELAHIARGRLLYETDRLDESIDAYQGVPYDSQYLTTMLYEVTWTYVRRGQLYLKSEDKKVPDEEKTRKARAEYAKALEVLDDLRALEQNTDKLADVDLLSANLRLQTREFDPAEQTFGDVLATYRDADERLQVLMADHDSRQKLLQDILNMGQGALTVDSALPAVAARRAAANPEVAKSLRVFKDLQQSQKEIEASDRLLVKLEEALSPTNPNRAELFQPLRSALKSSLSVSNTLLQLRAQTASRERALVKSSPELGEKLAELRMRREQLEAKVAAMPSDDEQMDARMRRFEGGMKEMEKQLHEQDMIIMRLRANLVAIDTMTATPQAMEGTTPTSPEIVRNEVRALKKRVEQHEAAATVIRQALLEMKSELTLSGGRGAAEQQLRAALRAIFDEEHAVVDAARDPAKAGAWTEVDGLRNRIDALEARNVAFRGKVDAAVDRHVNDLLSILAAERAALVAYAGQLRGVDEAAAQVRDTATMLALERVRDDLEDIVVRADVGLMDVAFGRKQNDTDTISKLQRAKAQDLKDLNQAYADLQRDEVR